MSDFAIIVTSLEARSGVEGNPVLTKAGDKFWATKEPEGWVAATSQRFSSKDVVPSDVKTWGSSEEAEKFAKDWKGHPWWCKPSGDYEIVELNPRMVWAQKGWVVV